MNAVSLSLQGRPDAGKRAVLRWFLAAALMLALPACSLVTSVTCDAHVFVRETSLFKSAALILLGVAAVVVCLTGLTQGVRNVDLKAGIVALFQMTFLAGLLAGAVGGVMLVMNVTTALVSGERDEMTDEGLILHRDGADVKLTWADLKQTDRFPSTFFSLQFDSKGKVFDLQFDQEVLGRKTQDQCIEIIQRGMKARASKAGNKDEPKQ